MELLGSSQKEQIFGVKKSNGEIVEKWIRIKCDFF